jgi:hypothetical protein
VIEFVDAMNCDFAHAAEMPILSGLLILIEAASNTIAVSKCTLYSYWFYITTQSGQNGFIISVTVAFFTVPASTKQCRAYDMQRRF